MKIGYCITGSFCTLGKSLRVLEELTRAHEVQPVMSENVYTTDTRFYRAEHFRREVESLCALPIIHTVEGAEPLGPKNPCELMLISPCTGNTLAKIANGITDTAVTMAAKAHLRRDRPLVISLASNDAMSQNLKNIASLLTRKSVYFLPMRQDDPTGKPHSLIAEFERTEQAILAALEGEQLRPLFL